MEKGRTGISGWGVVEVCGGTFIKGSKPFLKGKDQSTLIEMIEVITDLPSKQAFTIH
jgi:hypothetical protein